MVTWHLRGASKDLGARIIYDQGDGSTQELARFHVLVMAQIRKSSQETHFCSGDEDCHDGQ
jgi:hypothetical protein